MRGNFLQTLVLIWIKFQKIIDVRDETMTILEEIRDGFASMQTQGAMKINNLDEEYKAYIIRIPDGYGVAIPVNEEMEVAENFNSCKFRTGLLSVGGSPSNYLMLISAFEEYRNEFASLCAELLYPGENGQCRKTLLESPLDWWKRWKELVGNNLKERAVYSIIAEMCVLEHMLATDPSAEWTATRMGSHDIECREKNCEVKSTCKRYGAEIIIAGQHQLEHKKPLFLYFVRMEESYDGVSVNDMKQKLINAGYDSGRLESELQHQGLEHGASIRNVKYKILEKRKYVVDDNFPSITKESFKDNHLPAGITHVVYTVDLDAVGYTAW